MGNNPSKEPAGNAPSPGTSSLTPDKRAARGPSPKPPSSTAKAPLADPSATRESAAGQSSQSQASVQQRLESRNAAESPMRSVEQPDRHEPKEIAPPRPKEISTPEASDPVQVPISRAAAARRDPYESVAAADLPNKMYYSASHHLQRPPRMPLPIGDATATPGSPISGPDEASPLVTEQTPSDKATTAKPDLTTIEDDGTADELHATGGVGKAVPTTIEWTPGANKVYVTGTFVNWEKKFRLHKRFVVSVPLSLQLLTHLLGIVKTSRVS